MRRSGENERWRGGRRGLQIENYGKKDQKEWIDNTVTVLDPHNCTLTPVPSPLYPHPCTLTLVQQVTMRKRTLVISKGSKSFD